MVGAEERPRVLSGIGTAEEDQFSHLAMVDHWRARCNLRGELSARLRHTGTMSDATRLTVEITGTVQGVGFRPFVFGLASSMGLAGEVTNSGARVVCVVEGDADVCEAFVERVQAEAPELADVHRVDVAASLPRGEAGFAIVPSVQVDQQRSTAIPPDVATCAECIAEAEDPNNRRHGYPFICCTACGPRYSVVSELPYDRANTSMVAFPLCPECLKEYDDPHDRRFHAQATSCAECGPSLTDSTVEEAIAALVDGAVVAVKGLGGYQLLCRADSVEAVQRLRDRKNRETKPFALLVDSVAMAQRLVDLDEVSQQALESSEAPIVLAPARSSDEVAEGVAPGTRRLGVMLPVTNLHAILAAGVGVPLVCTSGNRSNEPIVIDDRRAVAAFADIADLVLTHDRPIERRADDSVGHVVAGQFQLLRRARGYAPRSVPLAGDGPTVLGVGAELKNTTCLAVGERASLSVHLGDLESPATLAAFEATIADQMAFAAADVALVVHDLHPEYLSSKFATTQDLAPSLAVQHHHAHLVSCLVENQHEGPAIGVVFDGLGWGDDGTAWGGEFLVGDASGYERASSLSTVAMPGGAQAVREPWRMSIAHCVAAFGDIPAFVRSRFADFGVDVIAEMCGSRSVLQTSSMGRLFDAVAALCGLPHTVTYEGEAAIALEGLAVDAPADLAGASQAYPWSGTNAAELVRGIVNDLEVGVDAATVAYRFHQSIAEFIVTSSTEIASSTDLENVALSGGVFQNRLLVEMLLPMLSDAGLRVLRHRRVPPNDGGISLGQVAIGRAALQLTR